MRIREISPYHILVSRYRNIASALVDQLKARKYSNEEERNLVEEFDELEIEYRSMGFEITLPPPDPCERDEF